MYKNIIIIKNYIPSDLNNERENRTYCRLLIIYDTSNHFLQTPHTSPHRACPHFHPSTLHSPTIYGGITAAPGPSIPTRQQDLRRLLSEESTVGISLLRHLHVLRMLRQAPRSRRSPLIRPICHHGCLVRNPNQENGSWW